MLIFNSVSSNIKLPFVEETPKTAPQPILDASAISVSSLLLFKITLKALATSSGNQYVTLPSLRYDHFLMIWNVSAQTELQENH